MVSRLQRGRFFKIPSIIATLIGAVSVLTAFTLPSGKPKFEQIDVERTRVVETAGELKLVVANPAAGNWIGTWATAAQPAVPRNLQSFQKQSLRLIVHTSVGGKKVRIKISNTYGDQPLQIGGAHIARRTTGADIDPASDRTLRFRGRSSTSIPARSLVVSDPVDLEVPALSDLAISLFFPETAKATTVHALAQQTNYVSPEGVDFTASVKFPVGKTIRSWPFLTGGRGRGFVPWSDDRGLRLVSHGWRWVNP